MWKFSSMQFIAMCALPFRYGKFRAFNTDSHCDFKTHFIKEKKNWLFIIVFIVQIFLALQCYLIVTYLAKKLNWIFIWVKFFIFKKKILLLNSKYCLFIEETQYRFRCGIWHELENFDDIESIFKTHFLFLKFTVTYPQFKR